MNYKNLINRIKQNDNSAVIEFYNEFYKEVYYVCYKITENEKDAEDIAQETLIKALDKIDSLKNPEGVSAWLKTIANNLSINYLRKNRKFDIVDNKNDLGEEIFEENRIAKKTPEDIVADKEVTDILTNMINKLPREQRITIFMFYYEELSVKEIAEIMDCSEATVRSRINYARKALRKQVDELENKGIKLRCIAILPFLFTIYSFEKTGVCQSVTMPNAYKANTGMQGEVGSIKKVVEVGGEVAKMSMKIKIAIGAVAAVVLVGGTIGAVSLMGNNSGSNNNDVTENPGQMVEEENGQETTDETIDTLTEVQTDGMIHWIKTVKWNEDAEGFTECLFNEGLTLPINLENIDTICAPYYYWTGGYGGANAETMQNILSNTDLFESDTPIATQTSFYDGWIDSDKEPDNITKMYLVNYNEDERLTTQQCYDNGWWYIEAIYNLEDVLGIEITDENYSSDRNAISAFDKIAEKYGPPSYIMGWDTLESINVNDGALYIELVYEYDDYVVDIFLSDHIMVEYNTQLTQLQGVYYYSKECWNKELEDRPIIEETIINGVTYKCWDAF